MAIATLIAAGRLDDRLIDRALGLLREVDPQASFAHWIDEGDAADLQLRRRHQGGALGARMRSTASTSSSSPTSRAGKRLLVADMDSTIIGQECIDELADYAGLKDEVARITERAMQGELDFAAALRERVRLLAGLDQSELAPLPRRAGAPDRRRRDAGPDDAGGRRELPAGLGRLPVLRRAGRARWSASTGSGPIAWCSRAAS